MFRLFITSFFLILFVTSCFFNEKNPIITYTWFLNKTSSWTWSNIENLNTWSLIKNKNIDEQQIKDFEKELDSLFDLINKNG